MKKLPIYYTFHVESEFIFNKLIVTACYSEVYATEQLRNSESLFVSRDKLCNNDYDSSSESKNPSCIKSH
jgi:hypothetical protein